MTQSDADDKWITLTWGVMPTQKQWNDQYRAEVGRGRLTMELEGDEYLAMEEAYGPPNDGWTDPPLGGPSKAKYIFDRDELYMVVQSLEEEADYHGGDPEDPAMVLVSSILDTLRIEWSWNILESQRARAI